MNLFIETPEREARRAARERRPPYDARAGGAAAYGAAGPDAHPFPQPTPDPCPPGFPYSGFAPGEAAGGGPAAADALATRQMPSQTGPMPRWMIEARASGIEGPPPAAPYGGARAYGGAAARREAAAGPYGGSCGRAPDRVPDWERYAPGPEAYREELAYDRMRARRRRRSGALRVVALVIAVPCMLAFAFVASYILTCILNGASPDDIAGLLADLAERVRGWIADLDLFE